MNDIIYQKEKHPLAPTKTAERVLSDWGGIVSGEKTKRFIFIVTTALFWFSLYAYVPIFPGYIENSGVSHGMVGIIIGSYGFSQMLIRIPLGIASDRLNKRKLFIILGLFFSLVSGLGLWAFKTSGYMLLFRSFAGIAAASWVTFSVLFSSYYKSGEATKASGYLLATNNLGQVMAMLSGSALAESFGERSSFLLAATAAIAGIIAGSFIFENKNMQKQPMTMAQLIGVGKSGNLMVMSILAVFAQFMAYGTVYGFTPIVAKSLGADSNQLGLLTTLTVLPGIPAGALSGSFFGRKFGEKRTLSAGFIIASMACLIIPFVNSYSMLVITQLIGGFGRGVVIPLLMGLSIKNVEDSKRASAMGFFQAIYGLGMFMGPVVVGFISDVANLNTGFFITAFIGIAAAAGVELFIKNNHA